MVGRFSWWDLLTVDIDRTARFMLEIFDYELGEKKLSEEASYFIFTPKGDSEGLFGIVPIAEGDDARSHWIGYLGVDDLARAVGTVEAAGGAVHLMPSADDASDTPFAIVTDPQGAVFAPFEIAPDAPDEAPPRGPGRVGWIELMTIDQSAAAEFYGELTGWVTGPEAELGAAGPARALMRGEAPFGLMRGLLSGSPIPPHFAHHIEVVDLDATILRARAAGGFVFEDPITLPTGRRATLLEPTGAPVPIWQPRSSAG